MPLRKSEAKVSADILLEGLPYILQFHGKTIVIKYGGNAMSSTQLQRDFCRDVVFIKSVGLNPVVVHGGGPQISKAISDAGLQSRFVQGLRITDRETMDIVERVVLDDVIRTLVEMLQEEGWDAFGLGGALEGGFIHSRKLEQGVSCSDSGEVIDLGYVGIVDHVETDKLRLDSIENAIPVIAPIGIGVDGQSYNINADTVAGGVAEAVKAEKLVILTDIQGILDADGRLISRLTTKDLDSLISNRVIEGGL